MKLIRLALGLAALLTAAPLAAQTQLGSYNDRSGLSRPVEGHALLNPDGSVASAPVAPIASTAVTGGLVLKNAPGQLLAVNVTTGATAGVVQVLNATAVPADGAVTPVRCFQIGANTSLETSWRSSPLSLGTGIVVVFSSGTSCFTKAASVTAFISGDVR